MSQETLVALEEELARIQPYLDVLNGWRTGLPGCETVETYPERSLLGPSGVVHVLENGARISVSDAELVRETGRYKPTSVEISGVGYHVFYPQIE